MGKLYPKLALQNIRREAKFYVPYLLTVIGVTAAFYIACALSMAEGLPDKSRYAYLSMFMTIGSFVLAIFSFIFLTYTNSFLSKRRQRELGLYNILGMGKGHIALVLGWETLYLALLGVLGGIVLGVFLQAAAIWAFGAAMGMSPQFGVSPSVPAMVVTLALIGGILLFNLLLNLRRVHAHKPVELLRESSVGEKEPKTRWLLALIGVAALGGGYAIALTTRSAVEAIALYFLAVLLVIIGTYCLFTAVSIVILKALRKNKKFYYKTAHFIGLSGMLHRMKRNAVGLANICILCTMVMVMVSGTLCLYLGTERNIRTAFPGEATMTVRYDPLDEKPLDQSAMKGLLSQLTQKAGYQPRLVGESDTLSIALVPQTDGSFLDPAASQEHQRAYFTFFTPETYRALTGVTVPSDGKAHLCYGTPPGDALTFRLGETGDELWQYPLGEPLKEVPKTTTAFVYLAENDYYLVMPQEAIRDLLTAYGSAGDSRWNMKWESYWDLGGDPFAQQDMLDTLMSAMVLGDAPLASQDAVGQWSSLGLESRENYGEDYYSLNSGFFFLGIFLGVIFLLATVLIIYYKQLSEGYEDKNRYHIMVQVGLEPRDVKRSVNSQMLVVFFAPLLVAAVHLAFDFPMVARLLTLFGAIPPTLFLFCTLGVFGAFTLVYILVYRLTARSYCKIIR